jgi:hypothetical protein
LEEIINQVEGLGQRNFIWKERDNQPNDWEAWMSDLIVEVFVVGKPEFPKNFSTRGERSILDNIGTIFITLQLHWSNGYCVSLSSSDDG